MTVGIEDFAKLDLRVGQVLEVLPHENADKLYVLKVDIGEKVLQIVAGLKASYKPQELENKQVVVLVNLEPKTLRGVESQGMVLAAKDEDGVKVLSPDGTVALGSIIR